MFLRNWRFLVPILLLICGIVWYSVFRDGYILSGGKKYSKNIYSVLGAGRSTEKTMFNYVRRYNQKIPDQKLTYIIRTYIWESYYEGINHDIAFVQMCHETNFLKFDGVIKEGQNNFNSLGTMSYDSYWACFLTIKDGIRAHVQHLKAYGSRSALNNKCIDPRFDIIKRGSVKNVSEFSGIWAGEGNYGKALENKVGRLLSMEAL